jgi:hypothetical protein
LGADGHLVLCGLVAGDSPRGVIAAKSSL